MQMYFGNYILSKSGICRGFFNLKKFEISRMFHNFLSTYIDRLLKSTISARIIIYLSSVIGAMIYIILMYSQAQQSIDSATLVQLVDDALGNYYYRTPQGQACWTERDESSEHYSAPLTPSFTVPVGHLVNVSEPQTNTQTPVYTQRVDLEQFQLIEEDAEEGANIPHDLPRITEADLDNRFGGDSGSSKRTDNFDRELLNMAADEFFFDPIVTAIEMPQLLALGYTEETIQYELILLKKRPSVSKADLFYLILDPRITNPFKKAFARYFEFYLDNYMPIAAEQSKKLKKLSTFIKHHRSVTAYLCRLKPQSAYQPQCRNYNN